ncbi:putative Major facilitator superfamily (MFS) profile domain-containing protein [Seiridium unicorne]|uniref:Major facilitator superfamily (MFS) profile domain-containing protein n=1 Tax=Seiridium unicorne TaxID=138068 RepID=A0ABR2V4J1_9PEZI
MARLVSICNESSGDVGAIFWCNEPELERHGLSNHRPVFGSWIVERGVESTGTLVIYCRFDVGLEYFGHPSDDVAGGIVSSFQGGAVLGTIINMIFADMLRRKKTIFAGSIVSMFGSASKCGAVTMGMLITGRFFGGVAVDRVLLAISSRFPNYPRPDSCLVDKHEEAKTSLYKLRNGESESRIELEFIEIRDFIAADRKIAKVSTMSAVSSLWPLIASAADLGAALLVNAVQAQYLNPDNHNQLRSMVAMNFVFSLFYTPPGIISWVYPAEIFPVEVRALDNAITTFPNWFVNLIFAQFTPIALTRIGFAYSYVFFVFNLIALVGYWFFYPEIKGRTLEQMDVLFGDQLVPHALEDPEGATAMKKDIETAAHVKKK